MSIYILEVLITVIIILKDSNVVISFFGKHTRSYGLYE